MHELTDKLIKYHVFDFNFTFTADGIIKKYLREKCESFKEDIGLSSGTAAVLLVHFGVSKSEEEVMVEKIENLIKDDSTIKETAKRIYDMMKEGK